MSVSQKIDMSADQCEPELLGIISRHDLLTHLQLTVKSSGQIKRAIVTLVEGDLLAPAGSQVTHREEVNMQNAGTRVLAGTDKG